MGWKTKAKRNKYQRELMRKRRALGLDKAAAKAMETKAIKAAAKAVKEANEVMALRENWTERDIKTAEDVLNVLSTTLNRLMTAPLDEAIRASRVSQLSLASLKAIELAALEKEVAAMEEEEGLEVIAMPVKKKAADDPDDEGSDDA
jgi:hypothetical protein